VNNDSEGTGYGFKTDQKIAASASTQPTTCQMKRPAQ
jgi:branched-chain amino acid transport system substrate-binding protein